MLDADMRDLSGKQDQEFGTPVDLAKKENQDESYHEALVGADVEMQSEQEELSKQDGQQERSRQVLKSDQKSKGAKMTKTQCSHQNDADEPMAEHQNEGKCFSILDRLLYQPNPSFSSYIRYKFVQFETAVYI